MRITKQDLSAENTRLARDNEHNARALNALCNGDVKWSRRHTLSGTQYRVGYFKTPRYEQVYCLITYRVKWTGQVDSTAVYSQDELEQFLRDPIPSECRDVYNLALGFVRESEYQAKREIA